MGGSSLLNSSFLDRRESLFPPEAWDAWLYREKGLMVWWNGECGDSFRRRSGQAFAPLKNDSSLFNFVTPSISL
jgi:hypothetical protein